MAEVMLSNQGRYKKLRIYEDRATPFYIKSLLNNEGIHYKLLLDLKLLFTKAKEDFKNADEPSFFAALGLNSPYYSGGFNIAMVAFEPYFPSNFYEPFQRGEISTHIMSRTHFAGAKCMRDRSTWIRRIFQEQRRAESCNVYIWFPSFANRIGHDMANYILTFVYTFCGVYTPLYTYKGK